MKLRERFGLASQQKERLYTSPEQGSKDNFKFKEISFENVPLGIQKKFEERRQTEVGIRHSEIMPWDEILYVENPRIRTYIASHPMSQGESRASYFIDVIDNKVVGKGILVNDFKKTEMNQSSLVPAWAGTTDKDYAHGGLGERRLALMHAYCETHYNLPLHSSRFIESPARQLWEKLATRGRAEKTELFDDDGKPRYRFIE